MYENLLDQKADLAKMTIDATAGVSALDKLKAKADVSSSFFSHYLSECMAIIEEARNLQFDLKSCSVSW